MNQTLTKLIVLAGLGLALAAVAWPGVVHAQEEPPPPATEAPSLDGSARPRAGGLSKEVAEQGEAELQKSVRVFQQRYLVKTHRVELLLGGSTSFNDPWIHHYGADAALLFHFSERWAAGVGGAKWFAQPRTAFSNIQGDYGLFPEKSNLQGGGWAEVQFSPVFGKFTSFGVGMLQVDAYLLAAGGAVRTTRSEALKPAGAIGVGVRIHTLRWLTLALEVRDLMFNEQFQDCDATATASEVCNRAESPGTLMNQWFGGVRLGIWLPPTVQYRYQR